MNIVECKRVFSSLTKATVLYDARKLRQDSNCVIQNEYIEFFVIKSFEKILFYLRLISLKFMEPHDQHN